MKCGASASLTMAVHLVRAHENLVATSESLKILAKSFVAWSLFRKARLCLATNKAQRLSASIVSRAIFGRKISDLDEDAAI